MSNTTKIDVYLKNPNGTPMTHTRFLIKPVRAGFWSSFVGLAEDTEIIYETNDQGYVQMALWPLPYPYVMTYSLDDDSVPGHFLFYVPQIDTVVQFQDLIVTKADAGDKYGDQILEQIVAAKAQVSALVDEAEGFAGTAKASAQSAVNASDLSDTNAKQTAEDRIQVAATQESLQTVLASINEAIVKIQAINLQNKLKLGNYTLWVDSVGKLRIYQGNPPSDTSGVVVGTQTA